MSTVLSRTERERAVRFARPRDQATFAAVRGILRVILGGYLNRAPTNLNIISDKHGRPQLSHDDISIPLYFNVSHTTGAAIVAVSHNPCVGVDVEAIRDDVPIIDIASRFFAPREVIRLYALPAHHQRRGFYDCWTRKEAYVKAVGLGLALPLTSFCVSVSPLEATRVLDVEGMPNEAPQWSLIDVSNHSIHHAAALAIRDNNARVEYRTFSDDATRDGISSTPSRDPVATTGCTAKERR